MNGLVSMPMPYAPLVFRQGDEAVFGSPLDREKQALLSRIRAEWSARIEAERMAADEGAGGAITSPFPQLRQDVIDHFTQDFTGVSIIGYDALRRTRSLPSIVDNARQTAEQEANAENPVCGINRLVNSYPVAAAGLLLLAAYLAVSD